MYGVDVLSLLSFMLYVIAKYPYKTDSVVNLGWRFVDIHFPTFMTYIIGKFTLQVDRSQCGGAFNYELWGHLVARKSEFTA